MAVVTDPISDFLVRFKNAAKAHKEDFSAPYSKVKEEIARILKEEGYLWSFEKVGEGSRATIKAKPRYAGTTPALKDVKRVSRPGLRRYVGCEDIPKVLGGMGIAIVSTPGESWPVTRPASTISVANSSPSSGKIQAPENGISNHAKSCRVSVKSRSLSRKRWRSTFRMAAKSP